MCYCFRLPSKGLFLSLTALAVLFFLSACGDSGTGPAPEISISITPTSAAVGAAEPQNLTATVTNASNVGVTWATTGGSISGAGLTVIWTAPVDAGSYSITATSVEDATKSAMATITVTAVAVSIDPGSPTLVRGEPTSFSATVTGTSVSTDVTWAATCGDLVPNGGTADYSAPLDAGVCEISATSVLDPTMSASAQISVRRATVITAADDVDDGLCSWDHCSLREAINAANGGSDADTIYLDPAYSSSPSAGAGGFGRSPGFPSGLAPGSSLPTISQSVTIIGEGSEITEIDMNASVADQRRAFDISGESGDVVVFIRGITVRNGVAAGGAGFVVRNGARLETNDVAIRDNVAVNAEGGGMVVVGEGSMAVLENTVIDGNQTADPGWPGGGISVVGGGSLQMMGGRISNNQTAAWGGGIRSLDIGMISLENTVIEDNQVLAGGFGGAGFYLEGAAGSMRTVMLTGITLRNNSAVGAGWGGGGAIRTNIDATISNSIITGNAALSGGGIAFGDGTLLIEETTIDGNTSDQGGGGLQLFGAADVTITNGTVNDNVTGTPGGGGLLIQTSGFVMVTGTTISGNSVTGAAGGGFGMFGFGTLNAENVQVTNNSGAAGGVLYYSGSESSQATFSNSLFDGNQTDFGGGAFFGVGSGTLTITGSTVSNNVASGASGGGIYTAEGLSLNVSETRFTMNSTGGSGGGLWLRGMHSTLDRIIVTENTADLNGGGLSAGGETEVMNSTLSGNVAQDRGGAILPVPTGTSPMLIQNTTISGNSAARGGGLGILGDVDLVHVTLTGNTATGEGPGLWLSQVAGPPTVNLTNTLLSANSGPGGAENCLVEFGTTGSFISIGGNLSDDATCDTAFSQGTDQNAVPSGLNLDLADNGGFSLTHALLDGSSAIDAGISAGLTTDQRGVSRDTSPDIGAVEKVGG